MAPAFALGLAVAEGRRAGRLLVLVLAGAFRPVFASGRALEGFRAAVRRRRALAVLDEAFVGRDRRAGLRAAMALRLLWLISAP